MKQVPDVQLSSLLCSWVLHAIDSKECVVPKSRYQIIFPQSFVFRAGVEFLHLKNASPA